MTPNFMLPQFTGIDSSLTPVERIYREGTHCLWRITACRQTKRGRPDNRTKCLAMLWGNGEWVLRVCQAYRDGARNALRFGSSALGRRVTLRRIPFGLHESPMPLVFGCELQIQGCAEDSSLPRRGSCPHAVDDRDVGFLLRPDLFEWVELYEVGRADVGAFVRYVNCSRKGEPTPFSDNCQRDRQLADMPVCAIEDWHSKRIAFDCSLPVQLRYLVRRKIHLRILASKQRFHICAKGQAASYIGCSQAEPFDLPRHQVAKAGSLAVVCSFHHLRQIVIIN